MLVLDWHGHFDAPVEVVDVENVKVVTDVEVVELVADAEVVEVAIDVEVADTDPELVEEALVLVLLASRAKSI